MDEDKTTPAKGQSEFEKAGAENASLGREIIAFMGQNKKWWLLPILVLCVTLGVFALVGSNSAAMPFIYTFF